MTDHCIHTMEDYQGTPTSNRYQCCRCLQMASFESTVRGFNCMEEKHRMHDAEAWHDVWEARKV